MGGRPAVSQWKWDVGALQASLYIGSWGSLISVGHKGEPFRTFWKSQRSLPFGFRWKRGEEWRSALPGHKSGPDQPRLRRPGEGI